MKEPDFTESWSSDGDSVSSDSDSSDSATLVVQSDSEDQPSDGNKSGRLLK